MVYILIVAITTTNFYIIYLQYYCIGVEDILREFRLTDTEIKLYLALLKTGEATVPDIVAKTKVYKSNAHDALGKLEQRGLASHVKKENKMFFSSIDPQRFFEIIEDKKQDLELVFSCLNNSIRQRKQKEKFMFFPVWRA